MSKRIKFIITPILLSGGFLGITFLSNNDRFWGISILSIFAVIIFAWALFEGLGKNATLLALVLPAMYTLGVGIFWFLLPATIYATFPVILLYGVGVYALCKTENIYVVSTFKKIALSRAANGVGFVLTLFTSFLLYDAILSLRISPAFTTPMVFVVSFLLLLQGLWSSELEKHFDRKVVITSVVLSFSISALNLVLFFWPLSLIEASLFLVVGMYILLGLGQAKVEGRLFKSTIREYLIVGALALIFLIFNTSWRG